MRHRHLRLVTSINNRYFFLTGLFIRFGFCGNTFNKVRISQLTRHLNYERSLIGIPFADHCALLVFLTRLDKQFSRIRDIEGRKHDVSIGINHAEVIETADNNSLTAFSCDSTQFVNLHTTILRNSIITLSGSTTSDTTGVEGTQGKLCTGFADSLCSNHADSLTALNHLTGCKVASVALCTYTVFRFTRQNRADFDFFDTSCLDSSTCCLANLFTCFNDDISLAVHNIMYRNTSEDSLRE